MTLKKHERILAELKTIISNPHPGSNRFRTVADLIKCSGDYRWVGLYRVDHALGLVTNVAWSGPGPPKYPMFPIARGLTGAAISMGATINVGDVTADPRYLTAFATTRSEIIVPFFDRQAERVIGTIDVESREPNAFGEEEQNLLELCAGVIRPLWEA